MSLRIKNVTIGLYGKHLIFWVVILVVVTSSVQTGQYLARHQQLSEASLIASSPAPGSVIRHEIELTPNGTVLVDRRQKSSALTILTETVELRYKLIDEPGVGVATAITDINLPKPIEPAQFEIRPILIHSSSASQPIVSRINDRLYRVEVYNLDPTAVYTLVITWPKNYLTIPFTRQLVARLGGNIIGWLIISLLLPIVSLSIMVSLLIEVRRSRSLPKSAKLSHAPPSSLPPAGVGLLVRGRITNRDIAATILDLAWRDFLELYSSSHAFSLVKKVKLQKAGLKEIKLVDRPGSSRDRLLPFERALTEKIFYPKQVVSRDSDIVFRVGHRLFSQKVANVYIGIYDLVDQQKLFARDVISLHRRYTTVGLAIFFTSLVGFATDAIFFGGPTLLFWVGTLSVGIIVSQLGSYISPLSSLGQLERQRWLNFGRWLADPTTIDYQAASAGLFEKYLPYAIVLGCEKAWLNRFRHQPFVIPDWFSSPDSPASIETFSQRLFDITSMTSRLLVSSKDPSVQ